MRRLIRRRARRTRHSIRRSPSSTATATRTEAKQNTSNNSILIGGINVPAEKQADQKADHIMQMPAGISTIHNKSSLHEPINTTVKRMPQDSNEDEKVQAKSKANNSSNTSSSHSVTASPKATNAIKTMGTGKPLNKVERSFFEPRFRADLSSVRIHDDQAANNASKSINARAFTLGNNIAFSKDEHNFDSNDKRHLMAHELAHVLQEKSPHIQRTVEVRPPGKGEASAFSRRLELIDRLNTQSSAIQYELSGREINYTIINESALTNFDRQMRGFIDNAELVPMRLITSAGFVGGTPLLIDGFDSAYVDLDDLLGSDDLSFQLNLIHILTERIGIRGYARQIGTNIPGFQRAHQAVINAEAEHLRTVIGDSSIRFNFEEPKPNGTVVFAFRSDENYRVFHIFRRTQEAQSSGEIFVQTSDRRRLTIAQLISERTVSTQPQTNSTQNSQNENP